MDLQWEAWAAVSRKGFARFLGEEGAVMPLTYPTEHEYSPDRLAGDVDLK